MLIMDIGILNFMGVLVTNLVPSCSKGTTSYQMFPKALIFFAEIKRFFSDIFFSQFFFSAKVINTLT